MERTLVVIAAVLALTPISHLAMVHHYAASNQVMQVELATCACLLHAFKRTRRTLTWEGVFVLSHTLYISHNRSKEKPGPTNLQLEPSYTCTTGPGRPHWAGSDVAGVGGDGAEDGGDGAACASAGGPSA